MDLVSNVLMEAGDTGWYRHQLALAIPGVSCHIAVWCGVVWCGVFVVWRKRHRGEGAKNYVICVFDRFDRLNERMTDWRISHWHTDLLTYLYFLTRNLRRPHACFEQCLQESLHRCSARWAGQPAHTAAAQQNSCVIGGHRWATSDLYQHHWQFDALQIVTGTEVVRCRLLDESAL